MRYSSVLLTIGLAAIVRAADEIPRPYGCLLDNCLRALKNNQRAGIVDCAAYSSAVLAANPIIVTATLTTTEVVTTFTPEPIADKRDIFRREIVLPKYVVSQCKGNITSRYESACSCLQIYSAAVTTISIPPVTVTTTSWEVIPATATALVHNGANFRISYTDTEGNLQYLYREASDEEFAGAFFTLNPAQASDLIINGDGNTADATTGAILACDKAGTLNDFGFLCAFHAAASLDLETDEPMKCARTGDNELKCGITGREFPVWAIIDGAARRRKRQVTATALGVLGSEEQADEANNNGILVGPASLKIIDIAVSGNSTTASTTAPPGPTVGP